MITVPDLFILLFYLYECLPVCMSVKHVRLAPTKDKRGCQIPWEWSYRQLRSSVRAKCPLQH